METEDKERIEKEAVDYSRTIKPLRIRLHHEHGYIAGATSRLTELASLREQLKQKEEENIRLREYLEFFVEYSEKSQYQLSVIKYDDVMYKRIEAKKLLAKPQ